MRRYVELHCHSAFSFLDGASLPDELAASALELGYEALALTDHNSLSGSMEFAVSARALGLRPLHGAEIDLADGRHLTLLVKDGRGWSNLCRILTRAHAHTREEQGRPSGQQGSPSGQQRSPSGQQRSPSGQQRSPSGQQRSPSGQQRSPSGQRRPSSRPHVSLEDVLGHAEGLVCLSGCALRGIHDQPTLRRLLEGFGRDGLRIELQRPFLRDDRARNRRLAGLATQLGVRCIATGNVHAHCASRAPLQDALVAVRLHTTLDASEPERRGNFSHVLASPGAMAARFPEYPEAVQETVRLADSLRFDLTCDLGYRYPGAEDERAMRNLTELCEARLAQRYLGSGDAILGSADAIRETASSRLQEELRIIEKLGLAGFFLLHHDLLELAREVAAQVRGPESARSLLPPGRGRGSSVSSIVCYLTGLSHVDPIANELLIGRFLNEELTSLPDIDLDFPRDIREQLIPRIHERYGHDRSALVAAFPTYRARGAIRELGKVLGLPSGEIERVARGSEGWDARQVSKDIEAAFGPDPGHRGTTGRWSWLARLAAEAHGLPRHLSQHSGGMIVSTRPLLDCCPIVPAAMEGRQIVQWDKDSCADAGFLKIDLLGLGMLSAVERSVELIACMRNERIDLSRIPYDDPATYACIQAADTTGVFQIESRAQMQSLRRTRPETLQDLTIQVAIVRPGPIQGGAVNPYIERRQRLRADPGYEVPYEHPSLEPVLGETLGTIIFQDQVLEVAIAFAGFSVGEAEGLRRAMSRKRSEAAIEAHHKRFVAGARRLHAVDEATAERVFAMVQGFSGFGFPKAHGAAFGLLAYQSTWLRVHYGPEFLCSLLNEQPMGFYPPDALVHEAGRRGIEVLPPDVNESEVECAIEQVAPSERLGGEPANRRVRIGLGYVRGIREREIRQLVAARDAAGGFRSLSDLASRGGSSASALELLAWSGACDSLVSGSASVGVASAGAVAEEADDSARRSGTARRVVLWQLGVATPGRSVPGGTQLALPLDLPAPPKLGQLSSWEAMLADYATTGLTVRTHPIALLRDRLPADAVDSRELETLRHGSRIRIGGLVVARQRPGTANGIVFVLLEDEHGTINLIVPAHVYERNRLTVRTEPLLLVEGKLERFAAAGGAINVLVDRIGSIAAPERLLADVKDFSLLDEQVRVGREEQRRAGESEQGSPGPAEAEDFRAVAPPVMSFASGRRR